LAADLGGDFPGLSGITGGGSNRRGKMLQDREQIQAIQKQLDELMAFKRYAEPLLRRYEEVCGGPQPTTDPSTAVRSRQGTDFGR
jgi:hypothetical protein